MLNFFRDQIQYIFYTFLIRDFLYQIFVDTKYWNPVL